MRSPRALANLVSQLRPGARISAAGAKFAPAWAFSVNLAVRLIARPYVTTFDGMRCPWDHLERLVPDLRVESLALGGAYLAYGEVHASGAPTPAGRRAAEQADARSADR